jgi:site-specific recombinase XerD
MTNFTQLPSVPSDHLVPFTDQLRLAVAAYLTRFKGSSREHTESHLRCYLTWCAERSLDPLVARRPHLELYLPWMQEIRLFKPSTVSRRFSVTAGFYRTCVIDGLLEHSPAEHVRRPSVPAESPTLGFTHLQFEALLTAARDSGNPCDFALVAMLGLLGLRIFEATGTDIADLGERAWPPGIAGVRQRQQNRLDPAATSRRARHRPVDRHPHRRPYPAQQPRRPDGPPRRHAPPAQPG